MQCTSLVAEPAPRGAASGAAWLVRAGVRLRADVPGDWSLRAPALLALAPGASGRSSLASAVLPAGDAGPLELTLLLSLPGPTPPGPEIRIALEAAACQGDACAAPAEVWYHQVLGRVRLDARALLGVKQARAATASAAAVPCGGGLGVRLLALPVGPGGWEPETLPETLRARGWRVTTEHWATPTAGRLSLAAPPDAGILAGCLVTVGFAGEAAELLLRAPGPDELVALASGLAAEIGGAPGAPPGAVDSGARLELSLAAAAEAGRGAAAEVTSLARAAGAALDAVRSALDALEAAGGSSGSGGAPAQEVEHGEAVAAAQRRLRGQLKKARSEVTRAAWPLEASARLRLPDGGRRSTV